MNRLTIMVRDNLVTLDDATRMVDLSSLAALGVRVVQWWHANPKEQYIEHDDDRRTVLREPAKDEQIAAVLALFHAGAKAEARAQRAAEKRRVAEHQEREEELRTRLAEQQRQREAAKTWADRRRETYPPIGDQLDALWKALPALAGKAELPPETTAMRDAIAEVKVRFPKPDDAPASRRKRRR